jgi:hypothetical protein
MTKDELLGVLEQCREDSLKGKEDTAHERADAALLSYINDKEISEAFHTIDKWYS